jgi:MFS family permease
VALLDGGLTTWSFMAFVIAIFFVASAGASSAYLTVSEIFPMETRALSIAFFYAVGTAAGGIVGPLLFGHLIASGSQDQVAIGFFAGAVVMAIGGIAELLFGVRAEQRQLEDIAEPLTAEGDGGGRRQKPDRSESSRLSPGPGPLSAARAISSTRSSRGRRKKQ